MPIQSANQPEIFTLDQWQGLNQQGRRGSIGDQEEWWNENFFAIGPGNLRSCWGHGPAIYTAPAGTQIVRMFFGFIGWPTPQFEAPGPPHGGRLGWMFLSNGAIDQVDLDLGTVVHVGGQPWTPIPPYYWASAKVWRPRFFGSVTGQSGGVLFGSPLGLFAWDGQTLTSPGMDAPDWLTDNLETGTPPTVMPVGLPGIYTMEVYQQRLFVAGKDVISFSAPSNGADFSTTNGGGSFGYFGDKLTYSFMDLCSSAGYLFCYGDSSTDMISNVQLSGQGTEAAPLVTNMNYMNIDPQVGHRFPRPVGKFGRYMTMFNGAGIYLMLGGDAQQIGDPVTNIFTKLDTSQYLPTMAPATMFGFKVMLCNGRFTDPFGVTRNLMLMWHSIQGRNFWSIATQGLELTSIGSYEQDSVITPYGTDGTRLYQLFARPDNTLVKRLSTKSIRGTGMAQLTIKNAKRLYAEIEDMSGGGVSITGGVTCLGGGVPGGTQDVAFDLPEGKIYDILPAPIEGGGIAMQIDLQSTSPDFVLERLHISSEERTLFGA